MSASISTHVLDTSAGHPVSGVVIALHRDEHVVARAVTDGDGRVRELAKDLAPGTYRLVFEMRSPFFRRIALDVEIGEGAHHIPLLVSPFGVTSYRGS